MIGLTALVIAIVAIVKWQTKKRRARTIVEQI
jgi:hypothetical protein